MMNRILKTKDDWTGLVLRLTIAAILFPHGAQKLLGWWNGHGYDASMHYFTDVVHLPYVIGFLVIMIEFFCPLFLLAGFASRAFALVVLIVMAGVIAAVQHQYFFMNWFGDQQGEGMEFFLLMIGLCIAVVLNGSGKLSVDGLLQGSKDVK